MQFRNLRAEELEGAVEMPEFESWLHTIGATDTAVLIVAPPGTGKAAAVGCVAHRLARRVILCDLTELLESADPVRQLDNVLRVCQAQRDTVLYLDKLDRALVRAEPNGQSGELADHLASWLERSRSTLLESACTVVCTGRDQTALPAHLLSRFDKTLAVR